MSGSTEERSDSTEPFLGAVKGPSAPSSIEQSSTEQSSIEQSSTEQSSIEPRSIDPRLLNDVVPAYVLELKDSVKNLLAIVEKLTEAFTTAAKTAQIHQDLLVRFSERLRVLEDHTFGEQ